MVIEQPVEVDGELQMRIEFPVPMRGEDLVEALRKVLGSVSQSVPREEIDEAFLKATEDYVWGR